jgi:probable metal-binding protein
MENMIQVHAHEVLNLIGENPGTFDTESLPLKLRQVYGMEATYFACSAADMTPEDLLSFLFERAKITETEGRLYLNRANICQH